MAFKYKDSVSKNINQVGDAVGWIANIIDGFASLFGVNLKKTIYNDWLKKGFDLSTLVDKINSVYKDVEVKDAKDLDRITKGLENLIGVAKSPTIKRAIGKLADKLNSQYQDVLESQGRHEVNKIRATSLANDIDSARIGDTLGTKFTQDVAELRHNLMNTAKESNSGEGMKTAKSIPSANFIEHDEEGNPVEERL